MKLYIAILLLYCLNLYMPLQAQVFENFFVDKSMRFDYVR